MKPDAFVFDVNGEEGPLASSVTGDIGTIGYFVSLSGIEEQLRGQNFTECSLGTIVFETVTPPLDKTTVAYLTEKSGPSTNIKVRDPRQTRVDTIGLQDESEEEEEEAGNQNDGEEEGEFNDGPSESRGESGDSSLGDATDTEDEVDRSDSAGNGGGGINRMNSGGNDGSGGRGGGNEGSNPNSGSGPGLRSGGNENGGDDGNNGSSDEQPSSSNGNDGVVAIDSDSPGSSRTDDDSSAGRGNNSNNGDNGDDNNSGSAGSSSGDDLIDGSSNDSENGNSNNIDDGDDGSGGSDGDGNGNSDVLIVDVGDESFTVAPFEEASNQDGDSNDVNTSEDSNDNGDESDGIDQGDSGSNGGGANDGGKGSGIVIDNQTVRPGESAMINDVPIALVPDGNSLVIDSTRTEPIAFALTSFGFNGDGDASSVSAAPAGVFTVDSFIATISNSQLIVGQGTTLLPGEIATVDGTRISLGEDGSEAIVGTSTIDFGSVLATAAVTNAAPSIVPLTIGSITAAISDSQLILGPGTTLMPGEIATVDGTPISLDEDGSAAIIGGTSTVDLDSVFATASITSIPLSPSDNLLPPTITILDSLIATISGTELIIGGGSGPGSGRTLTPGEVITLDGTPISFDEDGGSTVFVGSTGVIDLATVPGVATATATATGDVFTEDDDDDEFFGEQASYAAIGPIRSTRVTGSMLVLTLLSLLII